MPEIPIHSTLCALCQEEYTILMDDRTVDGLGPFCPSCYSGRYIVGDPVFYQSGGDWWAARLSIDEMVKMRSDHCHGRGTIKALPRFHRYEPSRLGFQFETKEDATICKMFYG